MPAVRSAALMPSQSELPGNMSAEPKPSPRASRSVPPSRSPLTPPEPAGSSGLKPDANPAEGVTSHLTLSPRIVSAAPRWLSDIMSARDQYTSPWLPINEGEVPISAPSVYDPGSAGLIFQTWRYGKPASRISRSAALVRTRATSSGQASLPPQASRSVQGSISRSAALTPSANGNLSKPSANRAEPPSMAGDQAKPRRKPSTSNLTPPSQAVRGSDPSHERSPSSSQ